MPGFSSEAVPKSGLTVDGSGMSGRRADPGRLAARDTRAADRLRGPRPDAPACPRGGALDGCWTAAEGGRSR